MKRTRLRHLKAVVQEEYFFQEEYKKTERKICEGLRAVLTTHLAHISNEDIRSLNISNAEKIELQKVVQTYTPDLNKKASRNAGHLPHTVQLLQGNVKTLGKGLEI